MKLGSNTTGLLTSDVAAWSDENKNAERPPIAFERGVKPRICMPTSRGFTQRAFLGGHYEAQDVLLDIDHVELIELEARPGFEFK